MHYIGICAADPSFANESDERRWWRGGGPGHTRDLEPVLKFSDGGGGMPTGQHKQSHAVHLIKYNGEWEQKEKRGHSRVLRFAWQSQQRLNDSHATKRLLRGVAAIGRPKQASAKEHELRSAENGRHHARSYFPPPQRLLTARHVPSLANLRRARF